jgi:hypothetical protein
MVVTANAMSENGSPLASSSQNAGVVVAGTPVAEAVASVAQMPVAMYFVMKKRSRRMSSFCMRTLVLVASMSTAGSAFALICGPMSWCSAHTLAE